MFALSFCIGPNSVSPNTQENRQKGGPLRKNARAIKTRWREAAAHGREGPNAIPVGRDAQGYTFPVRLLRTYRNMVKKPVGQCLAHSKMRHFPGSLRGADGNICWLTGLITILVVISFLEQDKI